MPAPLIHILHLSDIHLQPESDPSQHLIKLESDLKNELEVNGLEYLVLSGDFTNYATTEEYAVAYDFINRLVSRFGLDFRRVIMVPGNHDVNWKLSQAAYPFVHKSELTSTPPEGRHIPAGEEGILLCDEEKYRDRFKPFNQALYKHIYGEEYPLQYDEQARIHAFEADRILFLALNSAWEIDHYRPNRICSGIHPGALARALEQLMEEKYKGWLKIAVSHHPVTGVETMRDTAFLEQLAVHGFQVAMHGHIHKTESEYFRYDKGRGLNIIGAGTFGAPPKEQVTSIPLQYNLLLLNPETGTLTVETRKKEQVNGAWAADARWSDKSKKPEPRYILQLKK